MNHQQYSSDYEFIQIAYHSLKMKFDEMISLFEPLDNKKKIRVLILDITFIYNFLFGFFVKSNRHDLIFDQKYFQVHVIEILNFLAHYRRFFYSRLNAEKNYLLLYKSLNLKQEKSIYNEIFLFLDRFSNFIPDLYILTKLEAKIIKYFYHFYQLEIFKNYSKDIDFKTYLFTNNYLLKNSIYSHTNEYFINNNLVIEAYYQNNKIYLDTFENTHIDYKELFELEDNLLKRKAKENYFKFTLLQTVSPSLMRLKKKTKVELYKSIINGKKELKDLVSEEEYNKYLTLLIDIQIDSTNRFQTLVQTIINNKRIDLYNKELLYFNTEYLKNSPLSLSIEWLLNLK